ncbi:MAG: DUF4262 domain-containing protein [Pseudomonadota bacterium]
MAKHSEYDQELLANVEKHGWQFTFVFDPDGVEPDFAYSVGFTSSLNAPEFIVFGLPQEVMSHMLWEIYRQIQTGTSPSDGMRWENLLEGFDCISRKAVHPGVHSQYLISADWFWREQGKEGNPDVFQIVWPGARDGLFPWDDGCHQDVIDAQPSLW